MPQNKSDIDAAISKIFEMDDAGRSDKEIQDWIDKQPNKTEIYEAFLRIVQAFSSNKP